LNLGNKGSEVTVQEKQERAEDIANLLSNNQMWHSHGRMIGVETVKGKLRLKVEDYSTKKHFREKLRSYNDCIIDYINRHDIRSFLHNRRNFGNF